jgi:sulfofructose kinase
MRFPLLLPQNKEFDVVGFGTNAVDFLIEVPSYPEFNSKVALSNYTRSPGGEIASTLAGLARLGFSTAYVGRFGGDDAGKLGYDSLEKEGVNMTYAEFSPDAANQIAFIIIDERSGERTVIWQRDERLAYRAGETPLVVAEQGQILHLTPHDLEACVEMAAAAKASRAIISADVDKVVAGIEHLLPLVDILLMSSDFPEKLTGLPERRTALAEISSRHKNAIVGVTLGDAGSLIYCDGQFVESPGFAAPGGCRDTTGAGDAFRAGFLSGILRGKSVEDTCREANAVAALKCRAVGARTSLPTRNELDNFLS